MVIYLLLLLYHCYLYNFSLRKKKEVNYVKKLQLYLLLLFYIIFVPLHKNVYIAMHYYFNLKNKTF